MKDLYKTLIEDEKYQEAVKSLESEEERKALDSYMKSIMEAFQSQLFDPILEKLENDEEFKKEVSKKVEGIINK